MHTWLLAKMLMFCSGKRKLSTIYIMCVCARVRARLSARERVIEFTTTTTTTKILKFYRSFNVNLSIRQGMCHQQSKARTLVRTWTTLSNDEDDDDTSHKHRHFRMYFELGYSFSVDSQMLFSLSHAEEKVKAKL